MGGFTINGFGWGDKLYPKLGLGQHYCKYCKSMQNFALMEVQSKIEVLFIKTVTFNTKYAVCCTKCEEGYYVTEEQRDELLYQGAKIEVLEDGISVIKSGEEPIALPAKRICNKCGQAQPDSSTGNFCVYCGASLQGTSNERICKTCGAKVPEGQLFCGECGTKY